MIFGVLTCEILSLKILRQKNYSEHIGSTNFNVRRVGVGWRGFGRDKIKNSTEDGIIY